VAKELAEAYRLARATDPASAFGGVVALSREVDAATARELCFDFSRSDRAPAFSGEALSILSAKPGVRVLSLDFAPPSGWAIRQYRGRLLAQDADAGGPDLDKLEVRDQARASAAELRRPCASPGWWRSM
jgi:phosphoribosylaminoimidazolecarboxamide formyltransferase/IMP cyclohydrolase